jgi:hypothetical protein
LRRLEAAGLAARADLPLEEDLPPEERDEDDGVLLFMGTPERIRLAMHLCLNKWCAGRKWMSASLKVAIVSQLRARHYANWCE